MIVFKRRLPRVQRRIPLYIAMETATVASMQESINIIQSHGSPSRWGAPRRSASVDGLPPSYGGSETGGSETNFLLKASTHTR
jgi:hypothetical protein